MFKPVPKEVKEEILAKIKEGKKAPSLAAQYGISVKTIYNWLSKLVSSEVSLAAYNHLKKENEELKRMIGMMAYDMEKGKKRKIS